LYAHAIAIEREAAARYSEFAERMAHGQLETLDARLQLHLVIGRTSIARLRMVFDDLVAGFIDRDNADSDSAHSRAGKGGAVGENIYRVLANHLSLVAPTSICRNGCRSSMGRTANRTANEKAGFHRLRHTT
jgi:hypothetical protein